MNTFIDPQMLYSQTNLSSTISGKTGRDNPESLRKVCQEFEAILINSMYKGMRASIQPGGLIEKDNGTELFEEMMDMEVARQTALKQEMGIAEALYRQLAPKVPNQSAP